jgi:rhodanese-related sulfurtransferase
MTEGGIPVVPEIDVDELAARLEGGSALIDVRETDEYVDAHVPGAVLLPLSDLANRLDEVPSGEPVLLICKSGARSMRAAEALASRGHDVTNVAGGTQAWIASGRTVATGPERG